MRIFCTGGWFWRWFNERTVQLRTLPLVPSPTGPHPARGDSGVCMCIHVCLVWSVFSTAFIVPHHLPVCRQLHTDSPARFDSIWTWRNAHMRTEGSSPAGDRTRAARLAVQCSTNWATPVADSEGGGRDVRPPKIGKKKKKKCSNFAFSPHLEVKNAKFSWLASLASVI